MLRIMLAAVAASMFAGAATAQPAVQPPMSPPPLVDWSKIEIRTTDLGNKTYMLAGQGGNITVAVGSDAIIMVDGQFAPMHAKLKAAVAALTGQPIRYLVNTHFHGDHTGGNAVFRAEAKKLVAQAGVPALQRQVAAAAPNAPAPIVADTTFDQTWSETVGDEKVMARTPIED